METLPARSGNERKYLTNMTHETKSAGGCFLHIETLNEASNVQHLCNGDQMIKNVHDHRPRISSHLRTTFTSSGALKGTSMAIPIPIQECLMPSSGKSTAQAGPLSTKHNNRVVQFYGGTP